MGNKHSHAQFTGAFQLVCSGSPQETTCWFIWETDGKFQKQEIQDQVSIYILIFVDVLVIMQTTDMDNSNSLA